MVKVQEWLDQNYPKEKRNEITTIEIDSKDLEGELHLSDFTNLDELVVITKKQRNWENFYQWLNDNVVDINEKGLVKAEKKSEYTYLSTTNYDSLGILMNALENYIGKTTINYSWEKKGNYYNNAYQYPLLSYDDTRTFFQLASGQDNGFKCGHFFSFPYHRNTINDFERLLKNWKDSTKKISTTLTIKLGLENVTDITELENLNNKWKDLISKDFRSTSWKDVASRYEKGKDAILNDPIFTSIKDKSAEYQKEAWKSIKRLYQDGEMKHAENRMREVHEHSYLLFTLYEYKNKFLEMINVDGWIVDNTEQIKSLESKIEKSSNFDLQPITNELSNIKNVLESKLENLVNRQFQAQIQIQPK